MSLCMSHILKEHEFAEMYEENMEAEWKEGKSFTVWTMLAVVLLQTTGVRRPCGFLTQSK